MTDLRSHRSSDAPEENLSASWLWPVAAGVLMGLALRFAFSGDAGERFAAMTGAFIFLAPVLVAAVTVYVAELQARRTWSQYFWAGVSANCYFVLGTLAVMIEGFICAVVILPLFASIGGIAGVVIGAVCRLIKLPRSTIPSLAVLPFLVALVEDGVQYDVRTGSVQRTVVIDAPRDVVWQQLLNAEDIEPEEIDDAWFFRIGVPLVHSGVMRDTATGSVRRVTMGKNAYFDEVITDFEAPRHISWSHHYFPDSFPRYALDDHVELGGHYFDITGSAYTLTTHGTQTIVTIEMQYRVSTSFNWYADPVAKRLLDNLAGINLEFYKNRSEMRPG